MKNNETSKRKVDKRTISTTTAIKKTMLDMLNDGPFERISVKELCERIQINRTTFYIHYANTTEVLTEIIDEFLHSEPPPGEQRCKTADGDGHQCPYRLCDKVHLNRQYGNIIFNDSLKTLVIDRIAEMTKERYVRTMINEHNLSRSDAESIYFFQINGCLAVNKIVFNRGSGNFEHTNDLIASFIKGGLDHFKRRY